MRAVAGSLTAARGVALALVALFLVAPATASARQRVVVSAAATAAEPGFVDVTGSVRPAQRHWRVRVEARTSRLSVRRRARTVWLRRATSAPLGRSARFRVRATLTGPATLRVVVVSRGRVVARSRTLVVVPRPAPGSGPQSAPAPAASKVTAPSRSPGAGPAPATTAGGKAGPAAPRPETAGPGGDAAAKPGAGLASGATLAAGQKLVSPNGRYRLEMQSGDGNLVLYRDAAALWSTGAAGPGARAVMQADGNLVVYAGAAPKWASSTAGFDGASLALHDDGNLVVLHSGRPIWSSGRGFFGDVLEPGATLVPGGIARSADGQYRLVMQPADGNLVLYQGGTPLWATGAKGAGSWAAMQTDGNFVVYTGQAPKFATATDGFGGAALVVQNDGNVVAYHNGHAIWSRGDGYIGDRLHPGARLNPNAYLKSPNKQYTLVQQGGDGNLVIYGPSGAAWAWDTAGHPSAYSVMQGDGNFVVYDGSTPLRASGTAGQGGAHLRLQDDANLVVYKGSTALWSRTTGLIGGGSGGVNGPHNITNSAIADRAEQRSTGTWADQCLVFATVAISEAGGPRYFFGLNTNTYQAQWAQRATQIGSIAEARRGDIIQWGGGAGGNLLHTAIVTAPGANPSLIDSNWGNTERVNRGSFSSRNIGGSVYRIWRVGRL